MFTTIPYYASLTPVLEVKTRSGETTDYGPMLPQLEPAPDSLRLTSLFGRMVWSRPAYSRQIGRYERIACQAVERHTGSLPTSVRVRLDGQRLHRLDTVRSNGLTSYPQQASSRAYSCNASSRVPRSPVPHRP